MELVVGKRLNSPKGDSVHQVEEVRFVQQLLSGHALLRLFGQATAPPVAGANNAFGVVLCQQGRHCRRVRTSDAVEVRSCDWPRISGAPLGLVYAPGGFGCACTYDQ